MRHYDAMAAESWYADGPDATVTVELHPLPDGEWLGCYAIWSLQGLDGPHPLGRASYDRLLREVQQRAREDTGCPLKLGQAPAPRPRSAEEGSTQRARPRSYVAPAAVAAVFLLGVLLLAGALSADPGAPPVAETLAPASEVEQGGAFDGAVTEEQPGPIGTLVEEILDQPAEP